MPQKLLSYASFLITGLGGFVSSGMILLSELVPEAGDSPWFVVGLIHGLVFAIVGIILSFFFRNRTNTSFVELIVEGVLLFLSIIMMAMALVRVESLMRTISIYCGLGLFFPCLVLGISSLIGMLRRPKN